jgi:hypothetical protein
VTDQPNLAMVNRRENRLFRVIAGLVALVGILFLVVVGAVGYALTNNTEESRCLSATGLRFTASIMSLLDDVSPEERQATMERLSTQARAIDAALIAGQDPCSIELPPIGGS